MTTTTTNRGVAALALVSLAGTACSIGASNRTPEQSQSSTSVVHTAPDATTVLEPTETDAPTTTTLPRPSATVDELVDVDGGRLHVRCVGAGDTTVVLIAGFNDGGDNWGRIEPALSQRARVCSSARFGTGLSDPPPAPQTFATSARDLHTLLSQIGEPGPYVVVGHSYGGAQAVTFAAQFTYDEELHAPFYEAIAQGQRGDGSLFEMFAHGFVDDLDLGPTFAINCGDLPHPTTAADVEVLAAQAAGAATVLPELSGAYVRAFALPCTRWPVPAPATLQPVTAPGASPILVVGSTGDPATPSESAQRIATTLEDGHFLTFAGTGHITYGKDHCADAHIDAYLLDLRLPPESASCS